MHLLLLLILPLLMGIIAMKLGKGRITLKEFLLGEAIVIVLIGIGYAIALWGRTADTEIWNGAIAKKWQGTEGCCHSYPCNCRQSCTGSGKDQVCTTICDTCYQHFQDINWNAETSNGEMAYSDGCNSPYSSAPARWNAIVVGEPTAIEHYYDNYIKGNPDSILRRQGMAKKFMMLLPKYPRVHDHYRADRFIGGGLRVPEAKRLNAKLSEINAALGAPKQVNIIVILAATGDQMYLEGLREEWLGGKKNDLVVVIGLASPPAIAWSDVMSWTKNEEIKVAIRDRINALGTFDGDQVLDIVAEEVKTKFERRHMRDFEYLKATLEPPRWAMWLLFILGILITGGLQWYFWSKDVFGDEGGNRYGRFGRL